MQRPLVSVIIPTLNSEKYIGQAINSVISQTYKKWEIIVVDSGSCDRTRNIVRNYRQKNIKVFFSKKERGLSYARFFGILKSQGSYIAFLDSDDYWVEEKLSCQMTLPDYKKKFCCTRFLMFDDKKKFFLDNSKTGNITNFDLISTRPIALSSTIIHKKTLLFCIKSKLKNNYAEDYVWWINLTKKGYNCYKLKNILTNLRVHSQNRSLNFLKNWQSLITIYKKEYDLGNLKIIITFLLLIVRTFKKNLFKLRINKI